jgi:hypothetical protein
LQSANAVENVSSIRDLISHQMNVSDQKNGKFNKLF